MFGATPKSLLGTPASYTTVPGFKSQSLHFQSSFLLMGTPGGTQVLGSLQSMWKTQMEFETPGFNPAQPSLMQVSGGANQKKKDLVLPLTFK